MNIGSFHNYYPYTIVQVASWNSEMKRRSLDWECKCMRGFLGLEFQKHGGGVIVMDIPRVNTGRVLLENAELLTLLFLKQFLLMTVEVLSFFY